MIVNNFALETNWIAQKSILEEIIKNNPNQPVRKEELEELSSATSYFREEYVLDIFYDMVESVKRCGSYAQTDKAKELLSEKKRSKIIIKSDIPYDNSADWFSIVDSLIVYSNELNPKQLASSSRSDLVLDLENIMHNEPNPLISLCALWIIKQLNNQNGPIIKEMIENPKFRKPLAHIYLEDPESRIIINFLKKEYPHLDDKSLTQLISFSSGESLKITDENLIKYFINKKSFLINNGSEINNYSIIKDYRRYSGAGNGFLDRIYGGDFNLCLCYCGRMIASLGFDIEKNSAVVYQIQGVYGNQKELKEVIWPRLLLSATEDLSRIIGLESLKVRSARTNPYVKYGQLNLDSAVKLYDLPAEREGFIISQNGFHEKYLL